MSARRGHWEAVKQAFAADAEQRERDAAAMTAEERVLLGLRMGASAPHTEATERELDRIGLEQGELRRRYRALQAKRASGA